MAEVGGFLWVECGWVIEEVNVPGMWYGKTRQEIGQVRREVVDSVLNPSIKLAATHPKSVG